MPLRVPTLGTHPRTHHKALSLVNRTRKLNLAIELEHVLTDDDLLDDPYYLARNQGKGKPRNPPPPLPLRNASPPAGGLIRFCYLDLRLTARFSS